MFSARLKICFIPNNVQQGKWDRGSNISTRSTVFIQESVVEILYHHSFTLFGKHTVTRRPNRTKDSNEEVCKPADVEYVPNDQDLNVDAHLDECLVFFNLYLLLIDGRMIQKIPSWANLSDESQICRKSMLFYEVMIDTGSCSHVTFEEAFKNLG